MYHKAFFPHRCTLISTLVDFGKNTLPADMFSHNFSFYIITENVLSLLNISHGNFIKLEKQQD